MNITQEFSPVSAKRPGPGGGDWSWKAPVLPTHDI